jgi:hypothetical protein
MTNEEKAKMIAEQCRPCSPDFYSGIKQGVLLALNAESKSKGSKFTFIKGHDKQEISAYTSPRALKFHGGRPTAINIEANEQFNLVEFCKYIEYLSLLSFAMKEE